MKYVHAIAATPNGATVSVHRLHRVTLEATRVLVTLNHYVDADQELPTWQDEYAMPIERFAMGAYPDCVYEWMIAPDGMFVDGQLIDEDNEFDTALKVALHEVARLRDGHIGGGYTYGELGTFETDARSIQNIMGAVQMATMATITQQAFTVNWRLADNSTVALDAPTMMGVGAALVAYVAAVYQRSWELKELLGECQTVEEVQAVALDGWPEAHQ